MAAKPGEVKETYTVQEVAGLMKCSDQKIRALLKNNEVNFIVNTTEGAQAIADSFSIRREALQRKISYTTTIAGGRATLRALDHENDYTVHSLQQLHRGLEA